MSSIETGFVLEENAGAGVVKSRNKFGLALLATFTTAAVALVAVTTPFVVPAFRRVCLPYMPATPKQVENILSAIPTKSSQSKLLTIAEVGSGDGRVAIEIAKRGHKVIGLELNPWLVWFSRYKAFQSGLTSRTCLFRKQDLWKVNYNQYDRVVIFGVEEMMKELETKLSAEMSPGSQVVACRFHFPTLEPIEVIGEGIDSVWVYSIS